MENTLIKQILEGQNAILNRLDKIEDRLDKIEDRLTKVENNQVRMEKDFGTKINILFDAFEEQKMFNQQFAESIERVERKVDNLALLVASHEVTLKQIK
ncbi:MAG: hypothetical protein GX928_05540 [Ruminococcaceae bacterium]|nr:hypothetical protein [Oscillospiraceae bacterium]